MGNTILQTMGRTREGLLLWESFEAVDFVSDQGWTIFQGTPTISTDQAFNGLRSLEMDATYPQIRKTFPESYEWAVGYFYDTGDTTSTCIVGMTFVTAAGVVYFLGINNAVSTTNYVYGIDGVYTVAPIIRFVGWARLRAVERFVSGQQFFLLVGNAAAYINITTYVGPLSSIRVGCVNATSDAFGYFDLIQVAAKSNFFFYGFEDGTLVSAYGEDGSLKFSATTAGGVTTFAITPIISETPDLPVNWYITATKPDGVLPYYRSPVLEMSIGDAWTFSVFDLGRRVPSFQLTRPAMRDDKESGAGVTESLFYFSRDMVRLTLTDLTDAQRSAFMRFWGSVCDGSVFGVAIDSQNVYSSLLDADTVPNDATLVMKDVVGVNKGSSVMLIRSNGQRFEVGTVVSVDPSPANEIELELPPLFTYEEGDQVRHAYYWPYAIATDKEPSIQLTNPKLKRWSIAFNFKEALF